MEYVIPRASLDEMYMDIRVDEKISFFTQEKIGISLVQSGDVIVLDKKQALELKTLIENIWG